MSSSEVSTVQLQVVVAANDEARSLFDQIEVWRSTTGEAGPFEEITAASWSAARVPSTATDQPATPVTGPSVVVVGLELVVRVNEVDDVSITFTGTDPLTLADAAAQITTQGVGKIFAYVDADGLPVVQTYQAGGAATVRILEGDAAAALGLPTDAVQGFAAGKEGRIALKSGEERYAFSDLRGSRDYFYRTRFRNRLTGAVSEFGQVFNAQEALGVSSTNTIIGRLDLVGLDGHPLANVAVTVYNGFQHTLVEGKLVAESQQTKLTDDNGHVEFALVRGVRMTVSVSGTSIVRDVTVPTDAAITLFSLLSDAGSVDDVFTVQVPDLVYAEKRSL